MELFANPLVSYPLMGCTGFWSILSHFRLFSPPFRAYLTPLPLFRRARKQGMQGLLFGPFEARKAVYFPHWRHGQHGGQPVILIYWDDMPDRVMHVDRS